MPTGTQERALVAIEEAIALLEKATIDIQPELTDAALARRFVSAFSKGHNLCGTGLAAFTRKVSDPTELARATGMPIGKTRSLIATGQVMQTSDDLSLAMQQGSVSLDQAAEIASAEESAPGAAKELLKTAQEGSFAVLREKARKVKLEAEAGRDLFTRQREARSARPHTDELGMVNIHLRFQPHIGAPIVARAEADAARKLRAARKAGENEPFERHLADAYAEMLSGNGKGRAKRPELVVLVSQEVAERGWNDVKPGEHCKIPGVGPIDPRDAKEIAKRAFISALLFDGKDLRNLVRWTRHIPIEVQIALELGEPPDFEGVRCIDCGNRFNNEFDHFDCFSAENPTSLPNLGPRCWDCHGVKTKQDRARNWGRGDPSP